jgi:glycosyltransferase involved in cell wall biosynthesis
MKEFKIAIIIPVYNDWNSLDILISNIERLLYEDINSHCFIIVNDLSTIDIPDLTNFYKKNTLILNLKSNLGHQRAIACGLCYLKENIYCENVIIMDSDGEDKPTDILKLVQLSSKHNKIVFAKRVKRSENIFFKFMYKMYKIFFSILTGQKINFGNFSCIPYFKVESLIYNENIWNNYSAGVLKSKTPYLTIPTERGTRYDGKSKMSLSSLILHGFSAISVYMDLSAIRLVFFSITTIIFTFIMMILVLYIKLFTNMALPGWASYVILFLFIILFQSLSMGLLMIFFFLSKRTTKSIIPYHESKLYIS